jgi:GT2 family glycosyltransferase
MWSKKSIISRSTLAFYNFIFDLFGVLQKSFFYFYRYGFKSLHIKLYEKYHHNAHYYSWIKKNETPENKLELQRQHQFACKPKISIVVPTYNTPLKFLSEMIKSVVDQTYPNWELCIADGASTQGHVKFALSAFKRRDPRIKVKFLKKNGGTACNTNVAIALSSGEYIAFLDHDDILPASSLYEIVKTINEYPDADFIYSDEDKITGHGKRRFDPYFKPDWSPDLLRSCNYIGHVVVLKRDLLHKTGNLRIGYEGSQDYDLVLRASEKAQKIVHISKILYHWRTHKKSTAQNPEQKLYIYESARKALLDHLKRKGIVGNVDILPLLGQYKITYKSSEIPFVSIIIQTQNNYHMLKDCIDSILQKTTYKQKELIIIDIGSCDKNIINYYKHLKKPISHIKVLSWDKAYNYAAVNNFAAQITDGEVLLFLNNNTRVINNDWLDRMIDHVVRKEIGAVGSKLYYPNGTVQHAGLINGREGIAVHLHKYFSKGSFGYFGRLKAVQNVSAVSGACLMVRREVFTEVGGFDKRLSCAFNDVDLCFKIREKGYLIIWTPYAELYNHDYKTGGYENILTKRLLLKTETDLFWKKWNHILIKGDPYYNRNLNFKKGDFSIGQ